jgi:NMD protein affecting ribosome stability and mRNA decay
MVAVDLMEGFSPDKIGYCRRCGAVKIFNEWRRPDPDLWRGK